LPCLQACRLSSLSVRSCPCEGSLVCRSKVTRETYRSKVVCPRDHPLVPSACAFARVAPGCSRENGLQEASRTVFTSVGRLFSSQLGCSRPDRCLLLRACAVLCSGGCCRMRLAGARLSMMAGRVGRFIRDGAFRGTRSCADCVKQIVSCVVVSK